MSIVYYTIDLETNGLKANYHTVNEISIIRNCDRVQLSKMIICETPERSSYDALAVTHKTLADLAKGISKEQAIEACEEFFAKDGLAPQNRCIVGHNIISFDKKFLFALWESVGKVFPANLWMDTLHMIKSHAKQMGLVKPKVNLHAACDICGISKLSDSHNAKVDSRNTYLLWDDLINNKKIDYLPFIKTAEHIIKTADKNDDGEGLDPALLDL